MKNLHLPAFFALFAVGLLAAPDRLKAQIFDQSLSEAQTEVIHEASHVKTQEQIDDTETSGWRAVPLPTITLPKVTMPSMESVVKPFRSGYDKVARGTRTAWDGTKEIFSFGPSSRSPKQQSQQQPFWRRMFVSEPEPTGPQTIAEFMSQPRLDP